MPKQADPIKLAKEWAELPKTWNAIYKWKSLACDGNAPHIVQFIDIEFGSISLYADGLLKALADTEARPPFKMMAAS